MTPTLFLLLAFVRGVVVDPAARPVEGAKVACGTETTSTDSRGAFEFADQKTCEVSITKDGFAAKTVHLEDSQGQRIALALAPTSDRVVVTATGAPLALEDAGVSATVFTSADFTARANPFLDDYLRGVPGISIVQDGQNGALTTMFARGGDSSSTLVLLDGVPLTEPGGQIDLAHLTTAGIDRMEVIRGPESAMFGAEASSAVVQLFTHHGDPESTTPHGSLAYERGSFSTDHWTTTLDGGLAQRIDYAFTADQFRSTGEFPNDAYRITSGTANLGYRFSDRTSVRAIYREFDSYSGDPGQVYYGVTDLLAHELARDSALTVRLDDARGRRFAQHAAFTYHRYRYSFLDDTGEVDYNLAALVRTVPATPVPWVYLVSLVPPSTTTAPAGDSLVQETASVFGGDNLTVTDRIGADYQGTLTHARGTLVFGYQLDRQAGIVSSVNVARYDNGFFVQEQYALTPRIFVTAGLRLQQSNIFGTEAAPRASITFRLPTETFLRVSAARGIAEPSLLENFAKESFYVGNPALRPEKTSSYEIGLSHEWRNRRIRADAAVFRNSFHDLIEFDGSAFPGSWINVDRSWARGAEFSGTVRVTKFAAVRAGYTRLYTRITEDNSGSTGLPLLRQPLNSGSVSLELTPRRWTLIAGARIVGERQDNDFVFGINRNPGYENVFVSGSWQATRHFAPFVRVENALNELYQETLGYSALSRTAFGGIRVNW